MMSSLSGQVFNHVLAHWPLSTKERNRVSFMDISIPQFATSGRLGLYEMNHGLWVEHPFKAEGNIHMGTSMILESDQKSEDRLHGIMETSKTSNQEGNRPRDKISRRLAKNREAARKSRLRKKAYVQQLESSRLKLTQLEQELEQARQQGVYNGGNSGDSNDGVHGAFNTGAAMFEIEYSHWVEEQNRQTGALRTALQEHVPELDLRMLVENGLAHYDELFHLKASAAKSDVLHLLSGMWRTAAERLYFWIGGFRPSELLKILAPQLEPMTQQQITSVSNLRQSSQQAEDALSQGMEKLQQILAETLISTSLGASNVADYTMQMVGAMDKTEALRNFMMQADNLRQQTLHRMYRILTVRQAARGLLILGDYFQGLRALTSLWTARPC